PTQVENWEGCLSVDGLRGKVMRPSMVRVRGLDRDGKPVEFDATGLFAICIQHEMDHLQGKLFLDRMTDFSTLTQLEEFDQCWRHTGCGTCSARFASASITRWSSMWSMTCATRSSRRSSGCP